MKRRTVLRTLIATIGANTVLAGCTNKSRTKTSTSTPTPTPAPAADRMTPFDASENDDFPKVTPIEKEIHRLTNEARKGQNQSLLQWHDGLAYVARDHSRDMNDRNFLDHVNPEGEHPWDRAHRYGLDFDGYRENIAGIGMHDIDQKTVEEIAKKTFMEWKTSDKGHWENLLDERHTHEGIGVYVRETGLTATQMFGIRYKD